MTVEWVDRMRGARVLEVAAALGIEARPPRGSDGGAFPCPACGAERRHTKTGDKRPAAGVRSDGHGWRCFQCDASGDALDLVALELHGRRLPELADDRKADVRAWCGRFLGIDPAAKPPALSRRDRETRERAAIVERLTAPRSEPAFPDRGEVLDVWTLGRPIASDLDARVWMLDRGISPMGVDACELARIIPADATLPPWACTARGTSYAAAGWRLAVPMYDATGAMRSLRWRRLDAPIGDAPKTLASRGGAAGLVMADPHGLAMLCGTMAELEGVGGVVVLEGEADLMLAGSIVQTINGKRPALIGIVQGSAARDWTRKIPDGWLGLATDDDEAGDDYARELHELVAYRVRLGTLAVQRWRAPSRGMDVGDAGGIEGGRWEPMDGTTTATTAKGSNG